MMKQQEIRNAFKLGDVNLAKTLLQDNSKALHYDTAFGSWLHVAASMGQLEIVKLLISMKIEKNRRGGTFGGNALNLAANYGHVAVVDYLLSVGVEMDISEPERNPLFAAAQKGHLEVAKRLVEAGIQWDIKYSGKNMANMDAKSIAHEWDQTDVERYLQSLEVQAKNV